MDAVVLALCSAFLFGAMTVALRGPTARGGDPLVGALLTVLPALAVAVVAAAVRGDGHFAGVWPFLLAGVLAPGVSQTLFTFAVRDAGPSRTSAMVGMSPLAAVTFAVALLGETATGGVVVGAILVVAGGVLLASERTRPAHVKRIGLLFAFSAMVVFALRDTFVRWLSVDTDVTPQLAVASTLAAGALTILITIVVTRRPLSVRGAVPFMPAGLMFGLSYVCLFEAVYRGKLSMVAPLVATESLWGVLLSALLLRQHEQVGRRLLGGAAFVVLGGVLIGVFR
jgi:drug/metabolite transporter (DMT)-like permease